MSWEHVSFVIRSNTREALPRELEKPKTPTILAHELHTGLPNVSRSLRELKARGLIQSVTPGAKTGKIFVATDEGRAVMLKIREMRQ